MSPLRTLSRALLQHSRSSWPASCALIVADGGLAQAAAAAAGCGTRAAWLRHRGPSSGSSSSSSAHSFSAAAGDGGEHITVTFTDEKDGSVKSVQAPLGKSILEVAHENDVDLEGACEGSLACSTCHVVVEDQSVYDQLPEPSDDENDMLDLAFGLTDTSRLGCQLKCEPYMDGLALRVPSATHNQQPAPSRLGCQIICCKELDGLKLRIPGATRNMSVDGYRPKPH